ncbi:MAG: host attachment protein [Tsuneonella sp.]
MRIPAGAHVAIADGARFLLMRNTGSPLEPELTLREEPSLAEQGESGAFGHHDAKSDDYHEQDKLDHAAAVANWLNQAVLDRRIEQLVVVADPNTLGEMRRHYRPQTHTAVVEELDKQLTGMPGPDIAAALAAA